MCEPSVRGVRGERGGGVERGGEKGACTSCLNRSESCATSGGGSIHHISRFSSQKLPPTTCLVTQHVSAPVSRHAPQVCTHHILTTRLHHASTTCEHHACASNSLTELHGGNGRYGPHHHQATPPPVSTMPPPQRVCMHHIFDHKVDHKVFPTPCLHHVSATKLHHASTTCLHLVCTMPSPCLHHVSAMPPPQKLHHASVTRLCHPLVCSHHCFRADEAGR